jgi:hypothetical protein
MMMTTMKKFDPFGGKDNFLGRKDWEPLKKSWKK